MVHLPAILSNSLLRDMFLLRSLWPLLSPLLHYQNVPLKFHSLHNDLLLSLHGNYPSNKLLPSISIKLKKAIKEIAVRTQTHPFLLLLLLLSPPCFLTIPPQVEMRQLTMTFYCHLEGMEGRSPPIIFTAVTVTM